MQLEKDSSDNQMNKHGREFIQIEEDIENFAYHLVVEPQFQIGCKVIKKIIITILLYEGRTNASLVLAK